MIGCKALGSLGALSAEHPTVAKGFCSAYGHGVIDAKLSNELEAAKLEKSELKRAYDVALTAFERGKRRAWLLKVPLAHAVGREYVRVYDLYQISEEKVERLRRQIRKQSKCSDCHDECSPENPMGFQGHSIPR